MQELKISTGQAILLIVGTILPTAMLTAPTGIVKYATTDAWLSILLGTLIGICTAIVSSGIALMHPGLSFFQIMDKHLGRVCSKTVGVLFTAYFVVTSIDVLRQFTDFMMQSVLRKTPSVVLGGIAVLLALYAVYQGIEVIARVNSIVTVGGILVFAISTPVYFYEMKIGNLLPIFVSPIGRILMGAYLSSSWFTEVFVIVLLATFLNNPGRTRAVALIGVSATGLSLIWIVTGSIAIFGVGIIPLFDYPTFNVFRIIDVARFLERIDAFYIAIWVGMTIMKMSILVFFSHYCLCQTFGITEPKTFLAPFGLLTLTLSIVSWSSKVEYKQFLMNSIGFYLLLSLVVPVILYIALRLKHAGKRAMP
ncbi:hypothetical protein SD70_10180 [Gordoniibacillus kamchatkensis]|uniref:Uncharacterized protein n=1 Tax=Gordoniibacillus kamchatkensis TaxID=1590651 RepID=A0ABR5AIU9_9BACL|nr:endospore germination permease [Paenibacillus sp. VKM B-2647]KIL40979.1 hypothetical protein SD70_10180 [Paenibacillus sp. VKM B-2647]